MPNNAWVRRHSLFGLMFVLAILPEDAEHQPRTTAQANQKAYHGDPGIAEYLKGGACQSQHGNVRNSSGNSQTSEPFCSLTIQPCGLTTSMGQGLTGLGSCIF